MKFVVPVRVLVDPIVKVSGICNANPANPEDLSKYLSVEVHQDNITLLGTDNNVQLSAVIPLNPGSCHIEGGCYIEASKAREFIKNLDIQEDIIVETDDEHENLRVTIAKDKSAEYNLRIRRMDFENNEFPVFVTGDEAPKTVTIAERKLRYMIEKSEFCVSRDNYRDYLKGIRFEAEGDKFSIYGLDGHRMAVLDTTLETPCVEKIAASLTLRGAQELARHLRAIPDCYVTLKFTSNFVEAQLGCYHITSRILQCAYPNVRAVLPTKLEKEVGVNLSRLKATVKSASPFANKRLNNINMTFASGQVQIHSQNADNEMANVTLPISHTQPMESVYEVNLNVDFVKDFLNVIDTEQVVFGFVQPYSNTLIRPDEDQNELGVKAQYLVSRIIV